MAGITSEHYGELLGLHPKRVLSLEEVKTLIKESEGDRALAAYILITCLRHTKDHTPARVFTRRAYEAFKEKYE